MSTEGLLQVGRIGRAHGVKGDVFLDLTTDRDERAAVGTQLFDGKRWLTIERSARSGDRWRVHIAGVDTREAAAALTGTNLYATPIDDPDTMWIHRFFGATVVETDGTERGRCVGVIDNPAADILELEGGALVPVTFVTSVDGSGDEVRVTIDPPEGLFDLFDE